MKKILVQRNFLYIKTAFISSLSASCHGIRRVYLRNISCSASSGTGRAAPAFDAIYNDRQACSEHTGSPSLQNICFTVPKGRSTPLVIRDALLLFWFHAQLTVYPTCLTSCTVFVFYAVFGICSQKAMALTSPLLSSLLKKENDMEARRRNARLREGAVGQSAVLPG